MAETSGKVYYKHLDGVRAFAVLLVVVHHWTEGEMPFQLFGETFRLGSLIHLGGTMGVTLFFVLSGFLITNILMGQQEAFQTGDATIKKQILKTFYIRRTLRIFPIYYLYVSVLLIFGLGQVREVWVWLVTYSYHLHLFFSNQWLLGYIDHLWSLGMEEHYYLIWPSLLLFTPRKYNLHLILVFIGIGILTRGYFYLQHPEGQFAKFTTSAFDAFGIGSLLAFAYRNGFKVPGSWWLYWAGFLAWIMLRSPWLHFYGKSFLTVIIPAYSIGCAFLVAMAVNGVKGVSKPFFENSLVVYLGKMSYGIYLYHLFVPDFCVWIGRQLQFNIGKEWYWMPVWAFVCYAICSLSWRWIEQPVNTLKNRFEY
jgi:peptidoglycan/LPS O-acetylase OafA/YrhL